MSVGDNACGDSVVVFADGDTAQVVGKGLGPDPERVSTRAPPGESVQGVKRSRFALEAEEQQVGHSWSQRCMHLRQHDSQHWQQAPC